MATAADKFPAEVTHEGRTYYATGKKGTNLKTGLPSAEYQDYSNEDEARVWVDSNGTITAD
jgi:hypothetical protein